MSTYSSIEWTESTWNPITGCTKVSPGCKHCYAERMARRLQAMGQPNYANGFKLTLHENFLEWPLRWKKPQMIFVNSVSDLFHEDVRNVSLKQVKRGQPYEGWPRGLACEEELSTGRQPLASPSDSAVEPLRR